MVFLSRQRLIVGLLVILLLFIVPQVKGAAQQEEGQISIVIDFSHNSTYSVAKRNFTEAVGFFSNHPEYQVRTLEDGELIAANLSRSHILVIPNPMINYSDSELEVISDYVGRGGSLFLLSDYQVTDRQIGNPLTVNLILQALFESRIRFTTVTDNDGTEGDAIIDSVATEILPYNIEVNSSYLIPRPNREAIVAGINTVIVAGGSLTTTYSDLIVSTGSETSQAISLNGDVIQNQPGWLAAFWIRNSRVVLCSSTTMFSDTTCLATNQSWFQSEGNSELWHNIFKWITLDLVQDPTQIMIFFVALVLIVGLVVFAYSLWRTKRG
ncbi:MAG: hypothetical protein ACFE9D_03205 [Promethearchaeota archaeon]